MREIKKFGFEGCGIEKVDVVGGEEACGIRESLGWQNGLSTEGVSM